MLKRSDFDASSWAHLERCVVLAEAALAAGDAPFGSVLVDSSGTVLREDRNRVNSVNKTYHPEIELARWAAEHLTRDQRRSTTMFTSGEHCPMCSAAHGWAELGQVVFIHSTAQLVAWSKELGQPSSRVTQRPIAEIAPNIEVRGPVDGLYQRMYQLHKRAASR